MTDTERLDWLIAHHAMVGEKIPVPLFSGPNQHFVIADPFNQNWYGPAANSPREAIDAAMQWTPQPRGKA